MWGIGLALIAGMIAVNALFAAYEIALASLSVSRLHVLIGLNQSGAKAALDMKENIERSLATVQMGITLVGAVAAATGGAGAQDKLIPFLQGTLGMPVALAELFALALVVLPLTVLTILFGELIPKVFALQNKEWVCLRMSVPMRWFAWSVRPGVWFLETAVAKFMQLGRRHWQARIDEQMKLEAAEIQELRASAALARTSRLFGVQEEKIILKAAALSQRPVREIMLPANSIRMLDVNAPIADCLIAAHLDMHTRFPVTECEGDLQSVIGYVNFKDIVAHMRCSPKNPSIRAIVRDIHSFAAETSISQCLETLMQEHTHIALVRKSTEEVLGMVTLEDIIEELVGEIEDEYDRLPAHVVPLGIGWIAGGGTPLVRLQGISKLGFLEDLPTAEATNLNEWVCGHLDQPIEGGEILERDKIRVVVRKIRRNKVLEAQVIRRLDSN